MSKKEKKQKKVIEGRIGIGKFWAWESRELSDAGFMFLMGYIMFYCTDVLQVSPLIIGGLFAATKFIDGITDIIAGYIVDRTNSKWGKGRPYDICLVGAWVCAVFMFMCPVDWSQGAKVAWIVLWYVMANAVFYTFLNAGEKVFMLRAFDHPQIVRMTSVGSIATSLMGLACGIVIPQLINNAGKDPASWTHMAIMCAIPLALIGLARCIFVKEDLDIKVTEKENEKLELKEVFQMLGKNHYWMIFCLITLIGNIVSNMGVTVYYFDKIIGNIGIGSVFAAVSALGVIALVILPALMKKFRLQQILFVGQLVAAAVGIICFIFYNNIPVLVVCCLVSLIATVPGVYAVNLILFDNAIFNEFLGFHRMEGTMGSLNGFVKRCGAALGSLLLGVGLTLIQYDAEATVLAPITFWGLRFMMYGIPVISALLTALLWHFYKLEERMPEIKAELEAQESSEMQMTQEA